MRNTPVAILPSAEVGTLPGASSIDRRGQAHYSIPLAVAPGVRGMAPALALDYASDRGNGNLGVGFSLTGLSRLSRCPDAIDLDGEYAPVTYDLHDALCLDGNRLVLHSGTHGMDGAEYRPRRNPFAKVTQYGDSDERESWFEVRRKNGTIQRYGHPATWINAELEVPIQWALSSERDRFGNEITYLYDDPPLDGAQAELRITQIRYGGTGAPESERTVNFEYEARPDTMHGYFHGVPHARMDRLAAVVAVGPTGDVLTRYDLTYGQDELNGRSRLEAVQACDRFGMCMPPTTLTWTEEGGSGFDMQDNVAPPQSDEALNWDLVTGGPPLVGDFDGDGGHELVFWSPDEGLAPGGMWLGWKPWFDGHDTAPIDLPAPDTMPAGTADALAAMASYDPITSSGPPPVHRFGAGLNPSVIRYNGDARDDLVIPTRDEAFELDEHGHAFAAGLIVRFGYGEMSFHPVGDGIETGGNVYAMYPLDHDGNGISDLWMCRGPGYKSGTWVLAYQDKTPADATESFHWSLFDSGVGCSAHDEVQIAALDGGPRQTLMVVPAYGSDPAAMPVPDDFITANEYIEEVPPTPEADRGGYLALRFTPGAGPGSLEATGLPRDLYQRWHDLQCRNGVADAQLGVPVFGAGAGLDKQLDVNGDGMADIVRFELASGDGPDNIEAIKAGLGDNAWEEGFRCGADIDDDTPSVLRVYWNTGAGYAAGDVIHAFEGNAHAAMWLDFVGAKPYDTNVDGRQDLLMPSLGDGSGWTKLVSNGDGTFEAEDLASFVGGWPAYEGDEAPGEWLDAAQRSLGKRIFALTTSTTPFGTFPANDPDGTPDLAFLGVTPEDGGFWKSSVVTHVHAIDRDLRERLESVTDGLGAETWFDYAWRGLSGGGVYPVMPIGGVEAVVTRFREQASPNDDLLATNLRYTGGRRDAYGRGLLGYGTVERTQGDLRTVERYDLSYDTEVSDYAGAGLPTETIALADLEDDSSSCAGAPSPHEWESAVHTQQTRVVRTQTLAGGLVWSAHVSDAVTSRFEGSDVCPAFDPCAWLPVIECDPASTEVFSQTTTEISRDLYGTETQRVVTVEGGDTTTTQSSQITNDDDAWLLGLAGRTIATSCTATGECASRTVDATYDGFTGAVATTTIEPGDAALELTTTLSYDGSGNITSQTVAAAGGDTRTESFVYDDEGAFLEEYTNAEGHVSWVIHEPTSGAVAATVGPNGVTVISDFDGFFRPVATERRTGPFGESAALTGFEYAGGDGSVPLSAMQRTTLAPSGQRVIEDLGRNGQLLRRTWYGMADAPSPDNAVQLPPGDDVAKVFHYDERGALIGEGIPAFVHELDAQGHAPHESAITRDALGRAVQVRHPNGGVETTQYEATPGAAPGGVSLVTHTDLAGSVTSQTLDPHGRLVRTTDAGGTITCFRYGVFGQHSEAEVGCLTGSSRITGYEYDGLGRVVAESGPEFSTRSLTYDAFGNVLNATDGNGATTEWERDALGRPLVRTDADGETTYTWDTTWIGALAGDHSADGIQRAFSYDGHGRVDQEVVVRWEAGAPVAVFSTETEWDEADRVQRVTPPAVDGESAITMEYGYDAAGYLRALGTSSDPAQHWAAVRANAPGHLLEERFGEGTTTLRAYDPETLSPTSIETWAASTLQDLSYGWTTSGELRFRADGVHGQTEEFGYDALHRLTSAEIVTGPALEEQTITYDAFGNIRTKSDVGSYVYDAAGVLQRFGSPATALGYDDDGNVTTRGNLALAYTAQSKVRSMSTVGGGDESLSMRYDADGNRVIREDAANDTEVITLGGYERRVEASGLVVVKNTFPVSSGAAVRVVRTLGIDDEPYETHEYVHPDHLGSGAVVTDEDGELLTEVSFGPWGDARQAANWTEPVSDETLVDLGVGFTGHNAERDAGLIDMGGRIYDPAIARFMQVDPLVVQPANSQSYNRYSYVFNRPLTFTDPTGYAAIWDRGRFYPDGIDPVRYITVPDYSKVDQGQDAPIVSGGPSTPNGVFGQGGPHSTAGADPHKVFEDGMAQGRAGNFTFDRGDTAAGWMGKVIGAFAAGYGGACESGFQCDVAKALGPNHTKHQHDPDAAEIDRVGQEVTDGMESSPGMISVGITMFILGEGTGEMVFAGLLARVGTGARLGAKMCFGAGTLVHTETGLRPIEEIDVGDLVWARDEHTGHESLKPVTRTFITPDQPTLELALHSPDGRTAETFTVTAEHPFWSLTDAAWEEAADLTFHERVHTRDGPMLVIGSTTTATVETVYNLEVADAHTYFVGEAGAWVHNTCTREAMKGLLAETNAVGKTAGGTVVREARGGLAAAEARFGAFVKKTGANVVERAAGRGSGMGSGGHTVRIAEAGGSRVVLRQSSTHAGAPTIEIRTAASALRKIRFTD